jgi:adenylate cyclase
LERITAQLIDAQDAAHSWADRFDGSLDAIFDLQDEVATRVEPGAEVVGRRGRRVVE